MAFNITQRLTLMVAVFSGLILLPAGVALYVIVVRDIDARALTQARITVTSINHTIWLQQDQDILVDFAGGPIPFHRLRIPWPDWAVVRGSGHVETAWGILAGRERIVLDERDRVLHLSGARTYAQVSTRLTREKSLDWSDLPDGVQRYLLNQTPTGVFLWANRDDIEQRNVFAVQRLYSDRIENVSVTEQGDCVARFVDELPRSLPAWIQIVGTDGQTLRDGRIVGWQAREGELMAIVQGQVTAGGTERVAVNRLGECYRMDGDGAIGSALAASHLWVVVARDMGPDQVHKRWVGRGLFLGGVGIWSLMITIAWLVTKRALGPVHVIVEQAERIDASQLGTRLPVGPVDDELTRVSRTVNKMLDRLQNGYRRERQFTGDASHEMRNPLAKMIAEIDLALSKPRTSGEYRGALDRLKTYAQGMQRLVDSLLMLAQLEGGLQELEIKSFDVSDQVVEILKSLSPEEASRVHLDLGRAVMPMMAVGHNRLIGILLHNLIDNALRYSPTGSPVTVRIRHKAGNIRVEVQDGGPGIPEAQWEQVFHRFHRLEKSRGRHTGGAGLGLAIVKAIADTHHTTVTLTPGAHGGTLARFELPACHD